jgi:hypothetical protein
MIHTCLRCNKTFKHKYLLNRHNQRKYTCKERVDEPVSYTKLENKILEVEEKVEDIQSQLFECETEDTEQKQEERDNCAENNNHQCPHCFKDFSSASNLIRHKHGKSCKGKTNNVDIYERELGIQVKTEELVCRFCSTKFTLLQALSRHMNTCKAKNQYEVELEKKVLENRRRLVEMKEKGANIINQTNASQHHNNNNNNKFEIKGDHCINVVVNLPQLKAFGDENYDYLTKKLLTKTLEGVKALKKSDITQIVSTFTNLLHAHPAHPENHNVLFKSLNSGFAKVYNGKKFENRPSTEVQDTIIGKVGQIHSNCCDNHDYETNDHMGDVLEDIESHLCERQDEIEDNTTTRCLSQCRNAVKAALYSNKEDIETTQDLLQY